MPLLQKKTVHHMTPFPGTRWHAMSGIAFVLCILVIQLVVPPVPASGASETTLLAYYTTHGTIYLIDNFLAAVACLFALWFLCYLYTLLHRLEEPTSPLPIMMFFAGGGWIMILFLLTAMWQVFPVWATRPEMHPFLSAFSDVLAMVTAFLSLPAMLTIGIASWCAWHLGVWPRWFCLIGFLLLASQLFACFAALFPTGPLVPGGLVSFSLPGSSFGLWIGLASLLCVLRERTTLMQHEPGEKEKEPVMNI